MSAVAALAEALVAAGSDRPFWHEDPPPVGFEGVPRFAVEAYADARLAMAPPERVLAAVVGQEAAWEPVQAGWVIWRIARAWVARLGQLERRVRRLPASPMSMIREGREAIP
jgi:hypothetical protein